MLILTNQLHFLITYIWDEFLLEPLKNYLSGKSLTQSRLRGPTMWKDMLKNACKDIAIWRTKRQSSCTQYQTLAWMIITSRKRSLNQWENGQKCSQIVSECFVPGTNWWAWHSVVSEQTCSISHQRDRSLGQTMSALDFIHRTSVYRLLSCGQHGSALSTRWISRLRLCW